MNTPILEMRNITKEFPGVKALNNVSFRVAQGEIHCLVGENGAGKTTLIKHILGSLKAQQGSVRVFGISPDSVASHQRFREKFQLPFQLLADPGHAVADAYGVWGEKVNYGKKYMGIVRSAFVIDEEGRIAQALYNVAPLDTAPKALAALA